jgi:hypothetical protein
MCVNYTDLNKHCLKDPFGLPQIDQIIDSTAGSALLSFLDYYSGYHQRARHLSSLHSVPIIIKPCLLDSRTSAPPIKELFKHACLGEQIGDNAEAYVDDIVVKTKNLDMLVEDLKQTFENLNKWK